MAILAVASAKGSPGVTTTSLLLGGLWPRPVVVAECDPSGGDIAYRMPAENGQPLDAQTGLLSLAAAGRKSLYADLVLQHAQRVVGGLDVLLGVGAPEQAGGLAQQWPKLGPMFADLDGYDVICDLGRIGASSPQNSIMGSASAILLVVGILPSDVVHLRERVRAVSEAVGGPMGTPIHVAVVAPAKRTQAVREVREAIQQLQVGVAGVHHVAHDEKGVAMFHGQVGGHPTRALLVRSAMPMARTLSDAVAPAFTAPAAVGPQGEMSQ